MTYPRSLALLALTLALPACGPGDGDTTEDGTSTSTQGPSTGATTSTSATTDPTSSTTVTTAPTSSSTDNTSSSTTDVGTASTTVSSSTTDNPTDPTTGGGVCPEQLPMQDTPCDSEGLFCDSGCEDPCGFCNVVKCEGGTWQGLEVFPSPCLECDPLCDLVVAADCAGGPPDKDTCVASCMDNKAGACQLEFNQMLGCISAGGDPTFTCDDLTRPTVAGCETQFETLYMCMA